VRASEPVEALIFALWALFVCTVPANMWSFDKLVRLQYAAHRASWEPGGSCHDFFFRPPDARGSQGSRLTLQRCACTWLLRTPDWIWWDREALRSVFQARVLMLVSLVGVVGWIALVLRDVGALT